MLRGSSNWFAKRLVAASHGRRSAGQPAAVVPVLGVTAAVSPNIVSGRAGGDSFAAIRCISNGSACMVKRRPRKEDYNPALQKIIEGFKLPPMRQNPSGTEYTAPVTSAHMVSAQEISTLDSAVLSPEEEGSVVIHGRYGVIPEPAASSVPLEYLALLRPAAEGAAALRALTTKAAGGGGTPQKGTILVYGASEVNGMSACQLANAAGHAVIAVLAGNHAYNDEMLFCVKHMLNEPSTAIPQEVTVLKSLFRELVTSISTGDEGYAAVDPDAYLQDFKDLLEKYTEYYPNTRPAAVPAEMLEFKPTMMEKDREQWDANIRTYVEENYPPGAPALDSAKFDAFFSSQQYEIFRQKFWEQNSLVISGVELEEMNPPDVVQKQIRQPEEPAKAMENSTGYPYCFSLFRNEENAHPPGTKLPAGGPVLGAILCVNPELMTAAQAVAAAPTKRAKAETLKFLTKIQRAAYLSACSIVKQAGNGPVVVVGGELPGFETVQVTDADVQQALSAMDIDENGNTILNFFVQCYRANDFPFYADYAVFRKGERMSGPREFLVLK